MADEYLKSFFLLIILMGRVISFSAETDECLNEILCLIEISENFDGI